MRILLTGTYSSVNKGDAAMQQVFATEFGRSRPESELHISSPFPDRDTPFYAPIPVLRSRRRNLILATFHWLLLELLNVLGCRLRNYPLDSEIDYMVRADAVVDLSGDMLTEDYGPLVGYSHFLPLMQAQALGRPVVLCAQSLGPFRWLAPMARRILSRAKLITVRESQSAAYLAAFLGGENRSIQTADLAFLLQPVSAERLAALLAAEGITAGSRPRLGVSISALLANSLNSHMDTSADDMLSIFARALDLVVERLGVELLFVPHVFGPRSDADDRQAIDKLANLMECPSLRIRHEYRPEELKGMIAQCDAFIGCRMHANIAALDSGVPVLAVGYSHKTTGILSDMGLSEWACRIDSLDTDQLVAAIERLFREAPIYREALTQILPEIRLRAQMNIDSVIHYLIETTEIAGEAY